MQQCEFQLFPCRYLNLLENKETFPVLKDAERTVISLPPLTNSEKTRVWAPNEPLICSQV